MKKIFLSIGLFLLSFSVKSQFVYKNVVSDFDGNYKIAYSKDIYGNLLKLENVDGYVAMYITGGYFCDETPNVDLLFVVNGENFVYNLDAVTSENSKTLFLIDDLQNSLIIKYFLNGSKLKIRVNESHCDNDYYEFSLGNSTNAFNFMNK
jgi:hypothetical protein